MTSYLLVIKPSKQKASLTDRTESSKNVMKLLVILRINYSLSWVALCDTDDLY